MLNRMIELPRVINSLNSFAVDAADITDTENFTTVLNLRLVYITVLLAKSICLIARPLKLL